MRQRRAPRSLATALGTALERAEPATLLAAVQRVWPEAVGEAIAREASPVSERDGVVMVACRSATWAQELDLLSDQILVRIREMLGPEQELARLRFNASGDSSENIF
jgi:predicted nucleic acid-binding Zn ribbon protein